MAVYDFSSAFANLNRGISGLGDAYEEQRKRESLAGLGQKLAAGDYTGAAQGLLATGDVGNGLKAMELGQTRADRQTGDANFNALMGGGSGLGSIGAGASTQPAAGAQTLANLGSPNQVETRFMSAAREAGLNSPAGMAAFAATGKRESGFSPANANRSWSDPSQSGQAGTAGGIMSWRGPRLQAMYNFARSRGEQPGAASPETQALFAFQEDPTLVHRLNATKTPEEANRVMAQAWRYAGYDGSGPEYQARLNATRQYMARYNGQGGQPTQVAQADMPEQGSQQAQGFMVPGQARTGGGPTPQQAQAEIDRLSMGMARSPNMRPGQVKFIERRIEALQKFADPARALTMEGQELSNQKARRDLDGNQMSRQAQERAQVAQQYGLQPDTPDYRRFVVTGQLPAESSNIQGQAQERAQVAERLGLKQGSAAYQSYVLTGKMPREDQQPLSATDKKAILEADEMVAENQGAINNLATATRLSGQANAGLGAGVRAAVGNALPDWLVPDSISSKESSQATAELDNVVIGNALSQLKSIFGAAPTEGERAILMQMQGSVNQPKAVREAIYKRASEMAQRRLSFNQERAAQMRGGSYFKPGQGPQSTAPGSVTVPPAAVSALRGNPAMAEQFDAKYGQGMSQRILGRPSQPGQ